jgi:alpha/beta superfamily hydrolase
MEADLMQWPAAQGSEKVTIQGAAGVIEAQLSSPQQARVPSSGMLICHPHPLYGGAMSNKVVYSLAMAAHDAGCHALRFNFRGVGGSAGAHDAGRGEADDVVLLARHMREQLGCERLVLAGFSFGGFVAVAAQQRVLPDAMVSIAPALRYLDGGAPATWPDCPWLVIHGDDDDVVPQSDTLNALEQAPERVQLLRPKGTGHFFHGRLDEVRAPVAAFLNEVL